MELSPPHLNYTSYLDTVTSGFGVEEKQQQGMGHSCCGPRKAGRGWYLQVPIQQIPPKSELLENATITFPSIGFYVHHGETVVGIIDCHQDEGMCSFVVKKVTSRIRWCFDSNVLPIYRT